MFKMSLFHWLKARGTAKPVVLAKDVTLTFAESTLNGDIVYGRELHELSMVSHDFYEEVSWYLSTSLWPRGLTPKKGCVFIKDWDEDAGLTAALVRLGIVEIIATHSYGFPWRPIHEVQVVL